MERRTDDSFLAELNKLMLPLWGLRAGLRVTLFECFNKKVTVQYPDSEIVFAPIFRGKHSLLQEPVTKNDLCIMCKMCERICPNGCIEVVVEKGEDKKRRLVDYKLDLTMCLFCGLCEEVCPEVCIVLSGGDADYSSFSREGLQYDRHGLEREATKEEWTRITTCKAEKKKPKPKPAPKPEEKPAETKPAEAEDKKPEPEPLKDEDGSIEGGETPAGDA